MVTSVDKMEIPFFRYLAGDLPIKEFEQWVYSTSELENYLGESAYLELISFSFQQPAANYELSKLIYKYINPARFHAWQIEGLLKGLLDGTQDPVVVFENLYYLFLDGYQFLSNVGIQYVLGIDDIPRLTEKHLWNEDEFARRRKMLDDYLPPLKEEIEVLLKGLQTSEIEVINKGQYVIKTELAQRLKDLRQRSKAHSHNRSAQPKKKRWRFW